MMGQVSRCLRRTTDGYTFWCPGCREMHQVWTDRAEKPCWAFDGNVESPTFSPSILITGKQGVNNERGAWTGEWVTDADGKALDLVCHSFVTAGRINFLGDCTHALRGQTVALPDLPAWAVDNREEPAMSDLENAPLPADAPEPAVAAQEAAAAPQPATDGAEPMEPAPAPMESGQDEDSAPKEGEEPAKGAEPGKTEALVLGFDPAQIEQLTADLKAHIDQAVAGLREELKQEMNEFAGHFEGQLDKLDVEALTSLVERAGTALKAIAETDVAAIGERLTKLELQLRHSL